MGSEIFAYLKFAGQELIAKFDGRRDLEPGEVDVYKRQIYKYAKDGNTINWVFMGYPSSWGQKTLGSEIQRYVRDVYKRQG